jgi:hypothetical protein
LTLIAAGTLAASSITRPDEPPGEPGQVFVLQDYRWVPVIVKRTPTVIECSFEVVNGSPTVHAELLSDDDFRSFAHRGEYEALAETSTGASGGFTHIIETPGRYRVLVRNDRGAAPVAVSLMVKSTVDPAPSSLSKGISSTRKAVVILASLSIFAATALWPGRRLIRAYRERESA